MSARENAWGALVSASGERRALAPGQVLELGGLRLAPAGTDRLVLVCVVPPARDLWVESKGRRRTGAFLLEPGESLTLKATDWTFVPAPRIAVQGRTRCGFCRSALPKGQGYLVGQGRFQGRVLCAACQRALKEDRA